MLLILRIVCMIVVFFMVIGLFCVEVFGVKK